MQNLSKRDQILLGVLVFLLLFYGYYKIYLTPILNQIGTVSSEISNSQQELNNINLISVNNKKLKKQLEDLQTKFKSNENALPSSARNPELLTDIKSICDTSNLKFISFNFNGNTEYKATSDQTKSAAATTATSTAASGNLMVIPVNFTFSGDFASIMNFINSLEGDKRINSIDSLSLTPNGTLIQGNLNVNYYYIDNGSKNSEIKYDLANETFGKDNLFN